MRRTLCGAGLLAGMLVGGSGALAADRPQDEAAIHRVQKLQAEAWNRHDAAAYARLFTEDGDVVNVVGWWWKGRTGNRAQAGRSIRLRVSREHADHHRHPGPVPELVDRGGTRELDHGRGKDSPGRSGASPGNPAPGAREARGDLAHRQLPEHQQHSGSAVPGGAASLHWREAVTARPQAEVRPWRGWGLLGPSEARPGRGDSPALRPRVEH